MDFFQLIQHIVDGDSPLETRLGPLLQHVYSSSDPALFVRDLDRFILKKKQLIDKYCHHFYTDLLLLSDQLVQVKYMSGNLVAALEPFGYQLDVYNDAYFEKNEQKVELEKGIQRAQTILDSLQECLEIVGLARQALNAAGQEKNGFYVFLNAVNEIRTRCQARNSDYDFMSELKTWISDQCSNMEQDATSRVQTWLSHVRGLSGQVGKIVIGEVGQVPDCIFSNIPTIMDLNEMWIESIDFDPLLESLYFFDKTGKRIEFEFRYAKDRKQQIDTVLQLWRFKLFSDNQLELGVMLLRQFLTEIIGFFVIEWHTAQLPQRFYPMENVALLWENCLTKIRETMLDELRQFSDGENLKDIKTFLNKFIATAHAFSLPTTILDDISLFILCQYVELIKSLAHQGLSKSTQAPGRIHERSETLESVDARVLEYTNIVAHHIDMIYDFVSDFPVKSNELHDVIQDTVNRLFDTVLTKEWHRGLETRSIDKLAASIVSTEQLIQLCDKLEMEFCRKPPQRSIGPVKFSAGLEAIYRELCDQIPMVAATEDAKHAFSALQGEQTWNLLPKNIRQSILEAVESVE